MTETGVGSGVLNRPAARFVAIGLFLMAFFTALWASWSLYGLSALLAVALIVIFGAFAVIFVINGVQLFRSAAGLPLPVGAEAQRRGRILQVGFAVTFASEGVVIAIVCALLAINDGYAYFAPAIALVVGLHFIPFGFLFRRSIDFYIAAWAVIWAIVGIWLIASQTLAAPLVASLVGVATACGTSAYGVYMLRVKRAIMAALDESVHPASQQANARLRVQ
jgi:flagellar biosynthesis protein FliQ